MLFFFGISIFFYYNNFRSFFLSLPHRSLFLDQNMILLLTDGWEVKRRLARATHVINYTATSVHGHLVRSRPQRTRAHWSTCDSVKYKRIQFLYFLKHSFFIHLLWYCVYRVAYWSTTAEFIAKEKRITAHRFLFLFFLPYKKITEGSAR